MSFLRDLDEICRKVLTSVSITAYNVKDRDKIEELKLKAIKDVLLYSFEQGKRAKEAELAPILDAFATFECDEEDSEIKGN